jgi:chromosome segregation ATPase
MGLSTAEGTTIALAAAEEAASAEDEHATQAELLALATAVTQLEAELADSRQAAARSQKEAQAAREEVAQWQDREADARAQVQSSECTLSCTTAEYQHVTSVHSTHPTILLL